MSRPQARGCRYLEDNEQYTAPVTPAGAWVSLFCHLLGLRVICHARRRVGVAADYWLGVGYPWSRPQARGCRLDHPPDLYPGNVTPAGAWVSRCRMRQARPRHRHARRRVGVAGAVLLGGKPNVSRPQARGCRRSIDMKSRPQAHGCHQLRAIFFYLDKRVTFDL